METLPSHSPLRRLYPHLSEDELRDADDNLERYLAAILRIHQRLITEDAALTKEADIPTMKEKRSNHYQP